MNGQLHSQRNLKAQLKTTQDTAQPKFLIELAKPMHNPEHIDPPNPD